ncbi:MAG: hypothetical protein PHE79_05185 [Eubacteriales bacterium]|nr:hypothetical protein [Eubacteriales bacterium]
MFEFQHLKQKTAVFSGFYLAEDMGLEPIATVDITEVERNVLYFVLYFLIYDRAELKPQHSTYGFNMYEKSTVLP